jgi:hypothetical protein
VMIHDIFVPTASALEAVEAADQCLYEAHH